MHRKSTQVGWGWACGAALLFFSGSAFATLCGDGHLDPGEQCEPASVGFCSEACASIAPANCASCSTNSCASKILNGCSPVGDFGGSHVCYDLLHCVYATDCLDTTSNLMAKCYCGDLSVTDCSAAPLPNSGLPGAANGPCAMLIQQAFNLTTSAQPLVNRFTDPAYPGYYAVARLTCEKASCQASCFAPLAATPAPAPASPLWSAAVLALGLLCVGAQATKVIRRRVAR